MEMTTDDRELAQREPAQGSQLDQLEMTAAVDQLKQLRTVGQSLVLDKPAIDSADLAHYVSLLKSMSDFRPDQVEDVADALRQAGYEERAVQGAVEQLLTEMQNFD